MIPLKSMLLEDMGRLDQLPSLPAVVTQLLQVIDDPLASAMDVAYILREDPPLTARVLRMANSVVYGNRARVVSVPQAVLRLGMVEIRNMVLSLAVIRALARSGRRLDHRAFWQHCLTVALAAEALSRRMPRQETDDDDAAFAAGLLHDIGRLVLDQFFPEAFEVVGKRMQRDTLTLVEAERREMDVDHAEIGGLVATRWGLPEAIVAGVHFHHRPDDAAPSVRRSPLIVHAAEQICVAHGIGDPLEGLPITEPAPTLEALGVSTGQVKEVVAEAVDGARKSALLIAIARSSGPSR